MEPGTLTERTDLPRLPLEDDVDLRQEVTTPRPGAALLGLLALALTVAAVLLG